MIIDDTVVYSFKLNTIIIIMVLYSLLIRPIYMIYFEEEPQVIPSVNLLVL